MHCSVAQGFPRWRKKNKKFSGIEELSHQLDQDKRDIKQYFYKLKN
jgi:riboflavin kinase/FMN adenylyltransferase